MSDIQKTKDALSAPAKRRKDHVPAVGDVYVDKQNSYAGGLCRITDIERRNDYKIYRYEYYDFASETWKKGESSKRFEDSSYYRWIPEGADAIIRLANAAYNGDSVLPDITQSAPADTEALMTQGQASLKSALADSEALEDTMRSAQLVLEARIAEQKELLDQKRRQMDKQLAVVRKQLRNIQNTIGLLEFYSTENLDIQQVCEGIPAPAGTPLAIRQRILFMDEEMAVIDTDGQGLDYKDTGRFAEWLKTPANRDIIVPEQRCVVCMKPRRYRKSYNGDAYENARKNEWNHHTFIVMRNGENVYMIESDDIYIVDAAIPRKSDIEEMRRLLSSNSSFDKDRGEKLQDSLLWRSAFFAMIIQGIADNTEVFSPKTPHLSVIKNIGVEYVFDDEEDTLIGTGLPPFREFVKQTAQTIRRGSRIVYAGYRVSGGHPNRYYVGYPGEFNYNGPATPAPGIYNVDDINGNLTSFTYLPDEEIYNRDSWGTHQRTRRERWIIDPTRVLNFDVLTMDILEKYLHDRTQRESYESWIPMVKVIKDALHKEQAYEDAFIAQLSHVLADDKIYPDDETLKTAVRWWKEKVIYIRPIAKDDLKAWRMIKSFLKRNKKNHEQI